LNSKAQIYSTHKKRVHIVNNI